MVRRYRRSIYDELDELRASMDYLYQIALEPVEDPLLLPGDPPGIVCRSLHNLNAEVTEQENEIAVTVDMAPGMGNSRISVTLPDETSLRISCDREEDGEEDPEGSCPQERRSFSLHHLIALPVPVMIPGARLSLKNGVLDISLKKIPARHGRKS
jgi:HSP20 family molecular chaperone IbpA